MTIRIRPGFAVSVDRTIKLTERKSVFFKLQPSTDVNLRFLPSWNERGELFFLSAQHFNFTEDSDKRVWACLRQHGADGQECPICLLVEAAQAKDPDKYEKIIDKHKLSENQHAQVIVVPKEEGKAVEQLHIAVFRPYTAGKISAILKMERDNRLPLFSDPDQGQLINVQHNGKSGFASRYEPQSTGMRVPLDDLYPKWTDEFLQVDKEVALRIATPQQLVDSIRETVGGAVFASLLPQLA